MTGTDRSERGPAPARARFVAEASAYGTAALLALLGAVWTLDPRPGNLTQPWYLNGDALQQTAWVKGIVDHGWFLDNPDLGMPGGLHLGLWAPFNGDVTQALLVRVIAVFVDGGYTAANLFFLLTFPLVAVAALWALRTLEVSRVVALVLSVLYALLPYHFERNVSHISYDGYFVVPLLCVLLLDVLAGPSTRRRPTRGRTASPVGARCAPHARSASASLLGVTSAYYAAFALVLLGVGRAAARARLPELAGMLAGLLGCGVVVCMCPRGRAAPRVHGTSRSRHARGSLVGEPHAERERGVRT